METNTLVKAPKVSIIITFYNLARYLPDCILSIKNQTYENWEIIIVNDGSDKANSEVLSKIKLNYTNVKIISLKQNEGQLAAFFKGLELATGEFICMVDADDVLLPNYLKTLLHTHLNHNYALVSCACGEINSNNEITSLNYIKNPIYTEKKSQNYKDIEKLFNLEENFKIEEVKEAFGLWNWNPSTSGMFRKSALKILNYYPDKEYWKTGADKVIFSLLDLIGGSCNISRVCYLYRHHNQNVSNTTLTTGNKKYLTEDYIQRLIEWNKKLRIDTLKMFKKNKKEIIENYNKINYAKMLYRVIFCINIKLCAKIIKTLAHKIISF